jgi:hypothetical protein
MDVKSLYPSIPRRQARDIIRNIFDKQENKEVDTETLLEMMDAVLDNNNFNFNDKCYVQTEGTAIGSKLGRNYACVYMGEWERILLEMCSKQPFFYSRYVDDIFGIWTGTEDELKQFHALANNIHPSIQVDLRFSSNKIEFLDVSVSFEKGYLITDVYSKPADKHMYLNRSSSHPESTKHAIPFGLGIRARRICSTEENYRHQRHVVKNNLIKRGYSGYEVEKQLSKVDKLNRSELLKYNKRNNSNRVPLVLTYSKGLPNIHKILSKHQQLLNKSEQMRNVFKQSPIVAFRRDKNIEDILVHKKHNNLFFKKGNVCEPCGAKKCAICKYILKTDHFNDDNGNVYQIKNYINCKSCNVVYGIFCKICDRIVYVGETGGSLYQRHVLNLSLIRRECNDPVAIHFNSECHNVNNYSIVGIEKLFKNDIYRKYRENLWKKKLNTYAPSGINIREHYSG